MKIKEINTYFVRPRWGFVEIITDQGLSGWGEAVLEGHEGTVLACVHEMEDYLIGADPAHIEDIWTVLYRAGFYRGGGVMMSAISGIDQALWDIKGKYFNAPVHELMGGSCRNKMRVYSWIGGDRPTDVGAAAREKMEAGFTAVKMNATEELQFIDSYDKIDAVLERVDAIRLSCGKDFGIAIDFHGRVHRPMAKILAKKLEAYDPMFIEEPVLCEHMELFKEIADCCNIPIATGERIYTRWGYRDFFEKRAIDVIQPDICLCGGLTEAKKICDMSHAYDCAAQIHVCGSPISKAAALQIEAAIPNFIIHEHHQRALSPAMRETCLYDYQPVNGKYKVPDLPGLGQELTPETIKKCEIVTVTTRLPYMG